MGIQSIPPGTHLDISAMKPGDGWVSRRMFEGEPDPEATCQKIAVVRQHLAESEVLNSKGLVCPRPS